MTDARDTLPHETGEHERAPPTSPQAPRRRMRSAIALGTIGAASLYVSAPEQARALTSCPPGQSYTGNGACAKSVFARGTVGLFPRPEQRAVHTNRAVAYGGFGGHGGAIHGGAAG